MTRTGQAEVIKQGYDMRDAAVHERPERPSVVTHRPDADVLGKRI